jgi:dienelactone hydrolase
MKHPLFALWGSLALTACAAPAADFADRASASDASSTAVAAPPPAAAASNLRRAALPEGEDVRIPLPPGTLPPRETVTSMGAKVFRPAGPGPFPVVVFSHGRAHGQAARDALRLGVGHEQVRYWLAKGVAVVAPIRPGYGATGGGNPEDSDSRIDSAGRCAGKPDFGRALEASTPTVIDTLAWLRTQPWADAKRVLLVGQSVGGITTIAAGARRPEGVVGLVDFAGGIGGNPEHAPGHSCDPGQVLELYARYGRTTTLPSLWMYASNDQYWGFDEPLRWHEAFAKGGSHATFVHAAPVPDGDGHGLSRHAQALWAPALDKFLADIGFPGPAH